MLRYNSPSGLLQEAEYRKLVKEKAISKKKQLKQNKYRNYLEKEVLENERKGTFKLREVFKMTKACVGESLLSDSEEMRLIWNIIFSLKWRTVKKKPEINEIFDSEWNLCKSVKNESFLSYLMRIKLVHKIIPLHKSSYQTHKVSTTFNTNIIFLDLETNIEEI